MLTAAMPALALAPGSYDLVVVRDGPAENDRNDDRSNAADTDRSVLTVGAVGPQGAPVHKVRLVLKVESVRRVALGRKVLPVRRAEEATPVTRGPKVPRVRKAPKGLPARRVLVDPAPCTTSPYHLRLRA